MKKTIALLLLVCMSFTLMNCATILKGSKVDHSFMSNPPGAKVYVDGGFVGVTPLKTQINLNHKQHIVELEYAGQRQKFVLNETWGWGWLVVDLAFTAGWTAIIDWVTASWNYLDTEVTSYSFDGTGGTMTRAAAPKIKPGVRLAVMSLNAQGIDAASALTVSDMLRTEVQKTGMFTIIERSKMDTILKEQEFQQTGCSDASCAVQVGKILNVEYLMVGSIGRLGNKLVLNASLVDIESGKVVYAEQVSSGNLESMDVAVAQFASRLRGGN
ncbi:MAG: PEGA domain-containing protein [Spirochaetes bacterium]|nr:PEGA domain-containing protein [Spirochaetota bacterium]